MQSAPGLLKNKTATDRDEEVELEYKAVGDAHAVLMTYDNYMTKEMPHIKTTTKCFDAYMRIMAKGDKTEIDSKWKFSFQPVDQWSLGGDNIMRAIVEDGCRGETYRELRNAIEPAGMSEECISDVILYIFLARYMENLSFNIDKIFGLPKKDKFIIEIDSCCFDPYHMGGDDIHLDVASMASKTATIEKVFGAHTFSINFRGRSESMSTERDDDDDDSSDDDDSDDDFIVPDDAEISEDETEDSEESEEED